MDFLSNRRFLLLKILISVSIFPPGAFCRHICNANDLTAFCLITRQFKSLVQQVNPPIYPQFQELLSLLPNNAYQSYINTESIDRTTVNTYQDYCELEEVISSYSGGTPVAIQNSKNPFKLEVTEIHVNSTRLHNWLHLKISSVNPGASGATGKIKMGFLIVHDENSHPVGDFNHQLPCGADCDCKYYETPRSGVKQCLQADFVNHVPCMFTNDKVITHPGQLMFYDENGVEEIHASWHFAQHQDPTLFIPELQFKALVIENNDPDPQIKMTRQKLVNGGYSDVSNPWIRTGRFGWNPVYPILHPTLKTVGAWDYFRKNVYSPQQINCHKELTEGYYNFEKYPTAGPNPTQLHPHFEGGLTGARQNDYSAMDSGPQDIKPDPPTKGRDPRLYYGMTTRGEGSNTDFTNTGRAKGINDPEIAKLTGLVPISPALLQADRCICPAIPTRRPAAEVPPPITQIQGRKSHALQMIIAWLMLVPFGIFVSRYFKETYSKVFFLQEYWWFSIHVLCMLAALMFMCGGIYSMEVKRQEPIKWEDDTIMVHMILGSVAMSIFAIQVFLGFFRFRILELRIAQIFMHWFFGNLQYGLAIACIISSGNIVSGCLPCGAVVFVMIWIIVQIFIFIGMELHMRDVDKQLNLIPKRSYLPPPVMRVFHDSAPEARFRIKMLAIYALLCIINFVIIHMQIKYNENGESCFKKLKNEDEIGK